MGQQGQPGAEQEGEGEEEEEGEEGEGEDGQPRIPGAKRNRMGAKCARN